MADINLHNDRKTAKVEMRDNFQSALDDLTTNWSGFTQAQKVAVMRTGLIVVMRVVKHLMKNA